MHFLRAFNATTTGVKATKRTEEAKAGEERLQQASMAETATTETVATIFEGVAASRKRDRVGNDQVIADDTNVIGNVIGDTDDKSLYDEDKEVIPWVEGDTFVDVGEPLVVVHDNEDPDDDNDDDINAEVQETQFGYDDWINDAATDEADSADEGDDTELIEDKQVIVDEEVEQIRKQVQMKIEPMNKPVGRSDFYKDEIARLQKKNVVTLRKLKRDRRDVRSNEFLKKKLYERLVTMEKRGIAERANVEVSQRLQGSKFWQSYLSNS
jgi:ribosomal protein L19E